MREGRERDSVSPLRRLPLLPLSLAVNGELEVEVDRELSGVEHAESFSLSSPLTMELISVSSAPVCEVVLRGKIWCVVCVYTVQDGLVNTISCRTGLSRIATYDTFWSGHSSS